MRPVERREILDYVSYSERRDALRPDAIRAKELRRVELGDAFTFLFENRDTVRYQVHEMLRTEKIVREADIQHELSTYNELLGKEGELGCTLLIGIDDPGLRAERLVAWRALPEHLYVRLADGVLVRARFDPRQVGTDRLSSVQYLWFAVGREAPLAVGCDLPGFPLEREVPAEVRVALAADLADDAAP